MPHLKTPDGIDWYYELTGEPKSYETVVFLHGFGVSSKLWAMQVEFLKPTYQVLTLDLPGHGKSSWKDVNLIGMGKDIKYILEQLHIEYINIVASSFGGMLTLSLLKVIPASIHRIVLVGSLPKFAKSENYPAGLDIPKIKKMSDQFQGDYHSILDIFFRSLFSQKDRESEIYKWIKNFRKDDDLPNREALQKFLSILEKEDLRDMIAYLNCPILFMNGTEDYICPTEVIAWLEEMIPLASFVMFPGAGHFPFLTKPKEFNETLDAFLMA